MFCLLLWFANRQVTNFVYIFYGCDVIIQPMIDSTISTNILLPIALKTRDYNGSTIGATNQ